MNDFTGVVGIIESTNYETLSLYKGCVEKGYEWDDGSRGCYLEQIKHPEHGSTI
jgi:hypothetical protein